MTDMLFVKNTGPGTRMYRSPKPGVDDLVLSPHKWVQVDPAYEISSPFVRDEKKKVFESIKAETPPEDPNLEIPSDIAAQLDPGQIALVNEICLGAHELAPQFKDAIEVSKHISDSGIPGKGRERITVSYLREHHRPFLMAILDLEQRHQKRRFLIVIVKKQLERIASLPG